MNTNMIVSLIGFMGIGAIIKSLIDAVLSKRQNQSAKQHDFKETRYKTTIMLMLAMLDFENNISSLQEHGRNITTKEQLLEEIKAERNNMILFASDEVINAIKKFITSPTEQFFYQAAIQMRKDLYGLNTKLRPTDLIIQ